MGKIIGIDLGTTNSLATVWEQGKCRLIPNAFGEYLTPSVVSIDDEGNVFVGKTAKERLASSPEQTASVFKRFMGTTKKYKLGRHTYLPEELSSFVLRKLKEDAERYLGEPVEEAIISVPAYFNDMGRNATKRAGALAGLKVERIINEPSAAALACHSLNKEEDARVLVFDFGGGTLDVSLVECFDNVVEIVAVSGDNQLGGQDFDNLIGSHFIRTLQLIPERLTKETKALIRSSAEKCKRDLTVKKTAEMVVNCEQINAKLEITRKDVVTICAELFERMGKPIKRVLMDAQISPAQITQVVLVGGSCKMPVVKQYLKHLLNRDDIETQNPDFMIALGCGIYVGIKERNEEVKDLLLTDICPFSLGTGVYNPENPGQDLMSFIIQRNSPLPISRERSYVNANDNQTKLLFCVFQGEAMYVKDNIRLGELELHIPPRKAGEVECYVRYTYDINGVLEVNCHVPLTGENRQLVIVNKELGMTNAQVKEKLKEYESLKLSPAEDEENQYVLAWGERLYMQCNGNMKEEILHRLQYFNHVLYNDPFKIERVRKYITVFLAYAERIMESCVDWSEKPEDEGSWYDEADEEEKEMDDLFNEWDTENER